jgi:hypothetical protein
MPLASSVKIVDGRVVLDGSAETTVSGGSTTSTTDTKSSPDNPPVTGENAGYGLGLYESATYSSSGKEVLQFKSLMAGLGITLTSIGDSIQISAGNIPHGLISLYSLAETDNSPIAKNAILYGVSSTNFGFLTPPTSNGQVLSFDGTDINWISPTAQVIAGSGLTSVTSGSTVTLSLHTSGVAPGTYVAPTISVDGFGRITSASTNTLGEINTASTVGSGNAIYSQKNGVNFEFKSLIAGNGINITTTQNDLTINIQDLGVAPAFYGTALNIPVLNIDKYGRVIGASTVPVQTSSSTQYGVIRIANGSETLAGTPGLAVAPDQLVSYVASHVTQPGTSSPLMDGSVSVGTSLLYSRQDHVHPTDTSRAPLVSPILTGVPSAPTATGSTNTQQIATTAFVHTVVSDYVPNSTLGAASGVATLDSNGKLASSQIPSNLLGAMAYQGTWNASTNTPNLAGGTGTKGFYYKVSVAGSTLIDGNSAWYIGDVIVFDGTTWDKIDGPAEAVVSVAGKIGAVTLVVADVSGAAPLVSPALTGTPTAPTATIGTNTTQVATTAFVLTNLPQPSSSTPLANGTGFAGSSLFYSRQDHVHPTDTSRAPLNSPTFVGVPTGPTASTGNNTTQLATTAFVLANVPVAAVSVPLINGSAAVGSSLLYARQDHIHPTDVSRAPLASPTFTGVPAAPTASPGTNTTQLATTAFVLANSGAVPASVAPLMNGIAAVGVSLLYARQDHIHPTDTSLAPIASPTLTGVPAAPTAAIGTNTTQIATTEFVALSISASGGVLPSNAVPLMDGIAGAGASALYARGDHVHPVDISRAPLSSPALTGTPTAPTANPGTNTQQIATTAFVLANVTGGTPATASPLISGTVAVGTSLKYAREDHVHPAHNVIIAQDAFGVSLGNIYIA